MMKQMAQWGRKVVLWQRNKSLGGSYETFIQAKRLKAFSSRDRKMV